MKIKDSVYKAIQPFEKPKTEESGARDRKLDGRTSSEGDQVTFSEHARDMAKTMKAAREADDIRTDKVAEIKNRIQSGTYQTDSKEIARKLLADDLDRLL
jgi:negative regulator of flagellin synthesis FlgM